MNGHLVTIEHRDVCNLGFGMEDKADAVFLDLPHPWEAIPAAKKALKKSGGRLCSFSPCIEQVQKANVAMREQGFKEMETIEVLLREFQVRKIQMPKYEETRAPKRKLNEDGSEEKTVETSDELVKRGPPEAESFVTGVPLLQMPGHTGYLTFATLPSQLLFSD